MRAVQAVSSLAKLAQCMEAGTGLESHYQSGLSGKFPAAAALGCRGFTDCRGKLLCRVYEQI